jgi:hypothetical protein
MLSKPEEMGFLQIERSRNPKMNEKNWKKFPQTMHCILCHNNPILNVNPKTQDRKGLITYNATNGIVALMKHVNSNHPNLF